MKPDSGNGPGKTSAVEVVYMCGSINRKRARACRDVGVDVSGQTRSVANGNRA